MSTPTLSNPIDGKCPTGGGLTHNFHNQLDIVYNACEVRKLSDINSQLLFHFT